MKAVYTESVLMIERLHRRFLDVVNTELERTRTDDINNVQALILYNINSEEMTIGELTSRGYYLGSNVSYNVKKLVENEYLLQEKAPHDKRSVRIRLSPKGLALVKRIDDLYQRTVDLLAKSMDNNALENMNKSLSTLERVWSDYINNSLRHHASGG